jgi:hypothetical protein
MPANNEDVKVVAGHLYSPSCLEGVFSEIEMARGHKKRAGTLSPWPSPLGYG